MLAPGFFRDIPVMPGSQEVVRALAARYEVFIASAGMEVPTSFAEKLSAPHNREETRYRRVSGWRGVRRLLLGPEPPSRTPVRARDLITTAETGNATN